MSAIEGGRQAEQLAGWMVPVNLTMIMCATWYPWQPWVKQISGVYLSMTSKPSMLCHVLARPLQWMPQRFHSGGLALVLNHLFAHPLANRELDFLQGKVVVVEVTDLAIVFRLSHDGVSLVRAPVGSRADVKFAGDAYAFLLLATQREDADALFFQRQLRIEGDTAIGLYLKNFLDAMGEPPLPTPARHVLDRFVDVYERRCLNPN